MPINVNQPRKPRNSPLEDIALALGIAKDVYGIGEGLATVGPKLEQMKQDAATKEYALQAEKDKAAGNVGPVEFLKLTKDSEIAQPDEFGKLAPGAVRIGLKTKDGAIEDYNLKSIPGNRGDVTELRKERLGLPITKDTQQVVQAHQKIIESAKNPSAAGDLSLIFGYMKMLDPGSTVREGEFANAQNSAGIPDRVRAMYNQAINGQRLIPEQRTDFLNQSSNILKAQLQKQKIVDDQYEKIGKDRGFNRSDVIVDFMEPAKQKQGGLPSREEMIKHLSGGK